MLMEKNKLQCLSRSAAPPGHVQSLLLSLAGVAPTGGGPGCGATPAGLGDRDWLEVLGCLPGEDRDPAVKRP